MKSGSRREDKGYPEQQSESHRDRIGKFEGKWREGWKEALITEKVGGKLASKMAFASQAHAKEAASGRGMGMDPSPDYAANCGIEHRTLSAV